jgi:hypothetical protein
MEVVSLMNEIFTRFDKSIENHNVWKVSCKYLKFKVFVRPIDLILIDCCRLKQLAMVRFALVVVFTI